MQIDRRPNGNVVIILGINETVTIRGESIDVTFDEVGNTLGRPRSMHDVDEVMVTGRRRAEADYPPNDEE